MSDPASVQQHVNTLASAHFTALRHVIGTYPISRLIDAAVTRDRAEKARLHPNPLMRHGQKFFSQNDEDGILLEILRRTGLSGGSFLEVGVGNGLENNTLILLMQGWRGAWLGGEALAFSIQPGTTNLDFTQAWIDRDNVRGLRDGAAQRLGISRFDVLSIDLDGNDLHVLGRLVNGDHRPGVVIVEYNGKFPPPVRFTIDYNREHRFNDTDYFGASLQSFADLLMPLGYRLVACNITGANAFFVAEHLQGGFEDVPRRLEELFIPADYGSVIGTGHPPSGQTVQSFLRR
jgi:hypothetical protein